MWVRPADRAAPVKNNFAGTALFQERNEDRELLNGIGVPWKEAVNN